MSATDSFITNSSLSIFLFVQCLNRHNLKDMTMKDVSSNDCCSNCVTLDKCTEYNNVAECVVPVCLERTYLTIKQIDDYIDRKGYPIG